MRIFHAAGRAHTLLVSPGSDPDCQSTTEFFEVDGKVRQYRVVFDDRGKADVPDVLGRYMLAKELAQSLPCIDPKMAAQLIRQEERVRTMRHFAPAVIGSEV